MNFPSFEAVADLVRQQAGFSQDEAIFPHTRFERDLGITGDDGVELLEAVEGQFGITFTPETFKLGPNEFLFGPEASGFDFISLFKLRNDKLREFTVGELHEAVKLELKKKGYSRLADHENMQIGAAKRNDRVNLCVPGSQNRDPGHPELRRFLQKAKRRN